MAKIKTWWTGLKSEFSKIIWPKKESIIRQTVVVILVTVIVAILIVILDNIIKSGLNVIFK